VITDTDGMAKNTRRSKYPNNAFAVGSAWYCDLGFERDGDQCHPLPEDERQAQLETLFALQTVARSCLVHLSGPTGGEFVCDDPWLTRVETRCRAIMAADGSGIVTCR